MKSEAKMLNRKDTVRFLGDNAILLCLILMIVIIAVINPRFMSFQVMRDVLLQNSTKLIVACGMTFILISGGCDLSAGRVVGLAAVVTASLAQTVDYTRRFYPSMGDVPIFVPIIVAVIACAAVGLINGLIIAKLSINPFIATLGTQVAVWGINLLYFDIKPNSSQPIGGIKDSLTYLGSGLILGDQVPIIILIALAIVAVVWFILKKIRFGRNVYAVGGNPEAAMVSGINVPATLVAVYTIGGALFGVAGVLECARTGGATSAYGLNYEFDAISACVVGGISNTGGIGTVPGMVLGVFVFGIMNYGLTFIGINPYWQQIVKGVIIVIAVSLDVRKNLKGK